MEIKCKADELREARRTYNEVAKAFDKADGLTSVLNMGYEAEVTNSGDIRKGNVKAWDVTVIGENATIGIVVLYDRETKEYRLDKDFALTSRIDFHWDGLYMGDTDIN